MTKEKSKTNKVDKVSAEGEELTPRQLKFCELYASDREFFGNGVESYMQIYDIDTNKPNWYKTACVCSSKLLSNAKVCDKINSMLEDAKLNNHFVDKQLSFLLTQNADFGAKLGAIREFNKLKQRITEKIEHSGSISTMSYDKAKEYLSRRGRGN